MWILSRYIPGPLVGAMCWCLLDMWRMEWMGGAMSRVPLRPKAGRLLGPFRIQNLAITPASNTHDRAIAGRIAFYHLAPHLV